MFECFPTFAFSPNDSFNFAEDSSSAGPVFLFCQLFCQLRPWISGGIFVDLRLRFELELPTYLSQAGASEGWATDILTREKVNVMESSVPLLG